MAKCVHLWSECIIWYQIAAKSQRISINEQINALCRVRAWFLEQPLTYYPSVM